MSQALEVNPEDRLLATPLALEPFFLAARVSGRGSGAANAGLAPLGLKVRHYSVLALACSDANPTQRELSQFLVLDPSQIVSIIDDLEKMDAVERQPDPRDRRSKIIVATASGRRLYRKAKKVVDDSTLSSLRGLSAAQRKQFLDLLHTAAFN